MCMHLPDCYCNDAPLLAVQVLDDCFADDRAQLISDMYLIFAAILMVLAQAGMLVRWRAVFIVSRAMNAMFSAAKAPWVSVEPGAMRVNHDMAPAHPGLGHERIVSLHE